MKIAIVGAGALGSMLGFYLSGTSHEVWLLSNWQEHIAAIQHDGLICEHNGVARARSVQISSDPRAIGACDLVLVLVKSYQTRQAAERIRALLKQGDSRGAPLRSDTLVITLQNGLGNRELLAELLGEARVLQGVTLLGATLLGPGRIRHAGTGMTSLALPQNADPQVQDMALQVCGTLVEQLQALGLPAELCTDVETLIWSKLLVNAGVNALTALLQVRVGALALPPAREVMAALVAETAAVASARGTPIPGDPLARVLTAVEINASNYSSMTQDVMNGRPTEIAAINGAVVREGERLGVPTPYNRMICQLVAALEATRGIQTA